MMHFACLHGDSAVLCTRFSPGRRRGAGARGCGGGAQVGHVPARCPPRPEHVPAPGVSPQFFNSTINTTRNQTGLGGGKGALGSPGQAGHEGEGLPVASAWGRADWGAEPGVTRELGHQRSPRCTHLGRPEKVPSFGIVCQHHFLFLTPRLSTLGPPCLHLPPATTSAHQLGALAWERAGGGLG